MKHTVKIFPGDYQIMTYGHTDYLYCKKPQEKEFFFEGKGYTKDFFKQILSLDLDNQTDIIDFVQQYGVLLNTQNINDYCTYLNKIIAKEITETCPLFSTGVSMSLILFKQSMNLIKNILLLATAISLDLSNTETIEYFLTVLLQPYSYKSIIQSKVTWIFDGNTPLSRLAYYSGEFFRTVSTEYTAANRMQLFIFHLDQLINTNRKRFKKFESTNKTFINNKHMIPLFQPTNTISSSNPIHGISELTIPMGSALDLISPDYDQLIQTLKNIRQSFEVILSDDYKFNVKSKNTKNVYALMQNIKKIAQKLIVETINTYTENINYEISIPTERNKNYELKLMSKSLLQSIFLEIGNLLNSYQITICKYQKCNNPVISSLSRPALCCCHNHLTNYKSYLKRNNSKFK